MALPLELRKKLERQNKFSFSSEENLFENLKSSLFKKRRNKAKIGRGYVKFGKSVSPKERDERNCRILSGW